LFHDWAKCGFDFGELRELPPALTHVHGAFWICNRDERQNASFRAQAPDWRHPLISPPLERWRLRVRARRAP
jgi:hypothetical protein